jgi:hypothetical protein
MPRSDCNGQCRCREDQHRALMPLRSELRAFLFRQMTFVGRRSPCPEVKPGMIRQSLARGRLAHGLLVGGWSFNSSDFHRKRAVSVLPESANRIGTHSPKPPAKAMRHGKCIARVVEGVREITRGGVVAPHPFLIHQTRRELFD